MAKLEFISEPDTLKGRPYKLYRDWLNINFYEQLCSYCLLQFKASLQIEHYEPQQYALNRINDPTNLLLGCPRCNSGKKDYHPNHTERTRLKNTNHSFSVIDIREEDFAELFELRQDGALGAKSSSQRERVKFNIVDLLRLNTTRYKAMRLRCLEYVASCEDLLSLSDRSRKTEGALIVLIKECAERYLFLKAFDIPLSQTLISSIESYIVSNRPQLVT